MSSYYEGDGVTLGDGMLMKYCGVLASQHQRGQIKVTNRLNFA